MENYNRILELLEKETLTPAEQHELKTMQEVKENAEFISAYRTIYSGLQKNHISMDEMADYIMYKDGIEAEDTLMPYKIPAIDVHLRQCRKCSAQMDELKNEYSGTASFVKENLYKQPVQNDKVTTAMAYRKNAFRPVYAFASVFALGFVYLILFALSSLTTPVTLKYASVQDEKEVYVTRGRHSEEFLKSYEELEKNNYGAALNYLQQDINNNPDDDMIFYSYYVMGLTRLEMAQKSFIGLFPSYDEDVVKKGLNNLHRSVELNTSGRFENIKLDAFFFLAKGNLMVHNTETAKQYLNVVVEHKGSKMDEAASILDELE